MTSPISAIENFNVAASYMVATSAKLLNALTSTTRKKLEELGLNTEEIKTEDEALAAIEEKEKTDKTASVQNSETYYDKQIIADLIDLAEDLGLYVGQGTDIETLMDNIKNRLEEIKAAVEGNENLQSIADEYSNRYDYLYAQYMNKKSTLSNQILTSLDAMSINSIALSTSM